MVKIEHKILEIGEVIDMDHEACHIEHITVGPTGHMHLLMVENIKVEEEENNDDLQIESDN